MFNEMKVKSMFVNYCSGILHYKWTTSQSTVPTPSSRHNYETIPEDAETVPEDLKRDVVSVDALRQIWKDLDETEVNSLTDILVKFHLLIPYKCPESRRFLGKYIVPAMMKPSSSSSLSQIFEDMSLSPLVYWFAPTSD